MAILSTLPMLLLQAATLTPTTVPARGPQEALLTLDAPAAIHLSARSASGTSCEVTDRVRGPFATSGVAGRANCELDLLLDAGQYKVRLDSSARGKGAVTLTAAPFAEINATPVRLVEGVAVLGTLKKGQQASYWLTFDSRTNPRVRISGRNAGDVQLWRNGEWLEPGVLRHAEFSPIPGQPMHEWWLDRIVEAGTYRLVVYGRDATTVAGSSVDESLTVEMGFRPGAMERSLSFTLPASGIVAVKGPAGGLAAFMSLEASPKSPVDLQVYSLSGESPMPSPSACRIEKNALSPECSAFSYGNSNASNVVMVRGPPGTRGIVEWSDWWSGVYRWRGSGGYYGSPSTRLDFDIGGGRYVVGVHDLPTDVDAAPLGCQLEQLEPITGKLLSVVGRSVPKLGADQMLEREFNYDGSGGIVWVEIGSQGLLGGFTNRKFRITTGGGRKSACEVFRLETDGTLKRLTQSDSGDGPPKKECNELLSLSPGVYQVQLYGGLPGIEKLIVREDGAKTAAPIPMKAGCLLPDVNLSGGRYRLTFTRNGNVTVRGLIVHSLPLELGTPVHLNLDPSATISLPLAKGAAAVVRSSGGAPYSCGFGSSTTLAKNGECALPASTGETLTLTNPGKDPINVTIGRFTPPSAAMPPVSYAPTLKPLPRIVPETPTFFDFERGQSHSVVFDVEKPGLYNVTTLGLLSTECRLRTPIVQEVAHDAKGGRGRNCLVQTYLQKGRYMLTASTVDQSRGRGALFLSRRPAREFPGVSGEGESFFRVDANELVQQKLVLKTAGQYELGTTGQGQSFMCRLDDPDGWPVERVPSRCVSTRALKAGTYLWTQLPLTVESMRRTKLSRVRDAVVLKGNKPHPIDFFTAYQAELGADGKDEFLFKLEGETELDVVLTNAMQGRVYRLEADKKPKAVEVIPPGAPDSVSPEQASYEGEGEGEREVADSDVPMPRGDECESEDCGEGGGEYEPPQRAASPREDALRAQAAPPPPAGVKITLPAGQYKLVTEHSRGDVGVSYQLNIGSAILLPGMARSLPSPSSVQVLIPRDGTLRLRTEGEADVRCRFFDSKGQLVFEGNENGADWNCALAEPVTKGRYALVIESETQQRGETRVSLSMPAAEDKGPVTDGAKLSLGAAVVTMAVPVAEKEAVQELSFRAQGRTTFSCALEDSTGAVVYRKGRVTDCSMLVRPAMEKYRVRLWTTDGTAQLVTAYRSRPVVEGPAGQVPAGQAVSMSVAHAGRYRTSPQAWCLPGTVKGVLRLCGPEVSLEAGAAIFAGFGTLPVPVPLEEARAQASDTPVSIDASRQHFVQAVTASSASVFLMTASVQHGERASPACAFDGAGTVHEARDASCFAASAIGTEAVGRLWAASDQGIDAKVVRRAVPVPSKAEALSTGRRQLTFAGGTGLYTLPPTSRARLELTLPRDGWAVLFDDKGRAADFCAPTADLRRCVLTGQGGKLFLTAPDARVEVTTVLLEGTPQRVAFTGLYEDTPRSPGTVRLQVPAAEAARVVVIEGALHCTIALETGERTADCRGGIPAKTAAELVVEHGLAPVRALVHAPGRERWARLAVELPVAPGAALSPAVAIPLQAGRTDRTLVLDKSAVVRVSAETGVCGLFRGNDLLAVDGLDAGCELVRVLSPGTYRLLVRPFGARALAGLVRWTAEPVVALGEGVGGEDWLAPGDVRLYRFELKNKGRIGLGVQAKSEAIDCAVYNDGYQLLGDGCQQYLALEKGAYLLTVRNAPKPGAVPIAFKPVLLGLAGEKTDVPEDYLKNFFNRIGAQP